MTPYCSKSIWQSHLKNMHSSIKVVHFLVWLYINGGSTNITLQHTDEGKKWGCNTSAVYLVRYPLRSVSLSTVVLTKDLSCQWEGNDGVFRLWHYPGSSFRSFLVLCGIDGSGAEIWHTALFCVQNLSICNLW